MKMYIVWNENKTEGIITNDKQLAYEARKAASSNCFRANGTYSIVAGAFAGAFFDENCTIEERDDL